jgi:hypothetical protein
VERKKGSERPAEKKEKENTGERGEDGNREEVAEQEAYLALHGPRQKPNQLRGESGESALEEQ